jgi:hypothetical protein
MWTSGTNACTQAGCKITAKTAVCSSTLAGSS